MSTQRISVTVAQTISYYDTGGGGGFHPIRPEVTVEGNIEPGETLEQAHQRLYKQAEYLFMCQAQDQLESVERRIRAAAGDPIDPNRGTFQWFEEYFNGLQNQNQPT